MPVIGGAPMPEGRILAAAVRGDERELLPRSSPRMRSRPAIWRR